jgi:hypothetical protein
MKSTGLMSAVHSVKIYDGMKRILPIACSKNSAVDVCHICLLI